MRRTFRTTFLLAVLAMALAASSAASAGEGPGPTSEVSLLSARFEIENVNRSAVACESDGKSYTLRAHLAVPAEDASSRQARAVTLYVHGLGLSSYYWHFRAVRGYDHLAEMARLGHVGVVYDRLGYGENPKPLGIQSCYGSDADIASQLVTKLEAGDYAVDGGSPIAFARVVVASHSQAGLIVQPMAYSFDGADGLVITSWTDEQNHPEVGAEAVPTAQTCLSGGEQGSSGARPPFYAYYPKDVDTFKAFYFHNAAPEVIEAAAAMREPDPCGQGGSLPQTLLADQLHLGDIDVPVLLAYGSDDGYRPQPAAGQAHAEKFSGSSDVTLRHLADTGNALVLERTAPQFRLLLAEWLCGRGFAGATACPSMPKVPLVRPAPPPGDEHPDAAVVSTLPNTGTRSPLGVSEVVAIALGLVVARLGQIARQL